jgi:hypothetical protein
VSFPANSATEKQPPSVYPFSGGGASFFWRRTVVTSYGPLAAGTAEKKVSQESTQGVKS